MNKVRKKTRKPMTIKLHPMLRELRRSLKVRYGQRLKKIVLFGSYARGDYTPDSDMDVLIVLEDLKSGCKEVSKLVPLIADLNLRYGELASCVAISRVEYEKANTPLLINAHREGIVLHG